ncbi:hypothetical protein [Streptosporangium sp. NPDC048865]|uniref:hypothetical protein n=1 Tax=Streptosporangium sp. NPDC048865 TaxID=3155766 RepID=UPI0034217AAB
MRKTDAPASRHRDAVSRVVRVAIAPFRPRLVFVDAGFAGYRWRGHGALRE